MPVSVTLVRDERPEDTAAVRHVNEVAFGRPASEIPCAVRTLALGVALICALTPAPGAGAEPPASPVWSGEGGLSFVQTTGNSQNQTLGVSLKALRQNSRWKFEGTSSFVRTESSGTEAARRFQASLRVERSFTPRVSAFARSVFLRDLFAGLEGQSLGEAGGLVKLVDMPRHTLAATVALAYTDERRVAPAEDLRFVAGSTGLTYKWKLGPTANFAAQINHLANLGDAADWRLKSKASLTASVTSVLALKLAHELAYLNRPVPTKVRTDTTLLASLVVKWPGS